MAEYFLGSVGIADAYKIIEDDYGNQQKILMFTCKTLTDSAINISMSQEGVVEAKNGTNVCNFYYSPNVTINLTDILWKPEFLEAETGKFFENEDAEYKTIKDITATGGVYNIPYPFPIPLSLNCADNKNYYAVMVKKTNSSQWQSCICVDATHIPADLTKSERIYYDTTNFRICGLKSEYNYDVKYIASSQKARTLVITSGIIPAELFLEVHTPLFATTDMCNDISSAKHYGELIYEVPRFEMDGNLSLSASMSSTSSLAITGAAMNCEDGCNDEEGGTLMRVKEIISDRKWYEGLVDIIYDPETSYYDATRNRFYCGKVFGIYQDGHTEEIHSYRMTNNPRDIENIRLSYKTEKDVGWDGSPSDIYIVDEKTEYNFTGFFNITSESELRSNVEVTVLYCTMVDNKPEIVKISTLTDSGEAEIIK